MFWEPPQYTTYLDSICSDMDINGDTDFDPDKIYHTRKLQDHETMMEYLNELPTDTSRHVMGVNDPNHWNKNVNKGLDFLKKVRLTQGLDLSGSGDDGEEEDPIRAKIVKILEMTPN